MNRYGRFAILVIAPAILVIAGYSVMFHPADARRDTSAVVPLVRTETLSAVTFRPTRDISGFISGVRQTDVAPKTSGYVVKLLKEEGDAVRAGETIAVLDGTELSAMTTSANDALKAMRNVASKSDDYYGQSVDQAEAVLNKVKESRAKGDATSHDVDIAEEAVKSAKRMRDAQNAVIDAETAAAEGSVLVAQSSAHNAIVTAPFDGIVTSRLISLGTFVGPGTPIYAIAAPDALEVNIQIPVDLLRDVHKGDTVTVTSKDSDRTIQGKIFSIARAVGISTQSSMARIRFEDPAASSAVLLLGQFVTVSIPAGPFREVMLVPETAVVHEYDDTFVFVVSDSRVTKTRAILDDMNDGRRVLRSGIPSGSIIVTEGAYALRDGATISISD
ncbi:MAG: efflux RND transporter periplasmic adaptor subunit [Candidatus Moranbacteria bacterium]|nr:efflux RND transporter periplasmic adaptor subunit [Candidatus Moranbacteria bacterium]